MAQEPVRRAGSVIPVPAASGPKGGGGGELKVMVRRLPPRLPEPVFWDSVSEWVNLDAGNGKGRTATWAVYRQGKVYRSSVVRSYGLQGKSGSGSGARALTLDAGSKVPRHSRAYICFFTRQQASEFIKAFHGHLYQDKTQTEWRAHVSLAPSQAKPKGSGGGRPKRDPKEGTIEGDKVFQAFVKTWEKGLLGEDGKVIPGKALTAEDEALISGMTNFSLKPAEPLKPVATSTTTTPLIDFLRQRKANQVAERNRLRKAKPHAPAGRKELPKGPAKGGKPVAIAGNSIAAKKSDIKVVAPAAPSGPSGQSAASVKTQKQKDARKAKRHAKGGNRPPARAATGTDPKKAA